MKVFDMAKRFVFLPVLSEQRCPESHLVDFDWVYGQSLNQIQKNIRNLHSAAEEQLGIENILEVSTRSIDPLGVSLSAFNLELEVDNRKIPLECVYQSSKVFSMSGPHRDLLDVSPKNAKTDPRIRESGELTHFLWRDRKWNLCLEPSFYDYLYLSACRQSGISAIQMQPYGAYSDIAYSQNSLSLDMNRSVNCQARSLAWFVALDSAGLVGVTLEDWEKRLTMEASSPSTLF